MFRALALVALLLAGCASGPPAGPSDGAGSTGADPGTDSLSASSTSGSEGPTTSAPRTALFALVVRSVWTNRTSGDGSGPHGEFGSHCGEASWSESGDPIRVEVHRYGERTASPWPTTGILVRATEHVGFGNLSLAGVTAPVVAAFDAESDSVAISAAYPEHGTLAHVDADGSALAVDGVALARNETRVLDRFYAIEHDDGRWDVHERLEFTNHGTATVTVAATEGKCD